MARRDARHSARRAVLVLLLVVALVAGAGVASWRTRVLDGWTDGPAGEWVDGLRSLPGLGGPEEPGGGAGGVAPPPGLLLPEPAPPSPVATPVLPEQAGRLDAAAVRRALAPALADPALGRHVVAAVTSLAGGPVVTRGSDPVVPASTTKLLTAAAALHVLGPERTFVTATVLDGGTVVLVGGGDPLLARRPPADGPARPRQADLRTLARATAQALAGTGQTSVRVAVDDTLFTGPVASPRWRTDYVAEGIVAPITALWVDQADDPDGSGRVADPALEAGRVLGSELRRAGVRVRGRVVRRPAAPDAAELARVHSATVADLAAHTLLVSDNETAEVLAHHVGLVATGTGSFAGGVEGTRHALADLGVRLDGARLFDGSGLSRANRLSSATLIDVLAAAAADDRPDLRTVLAGLPVAGFSGSLADRFDRGSPAGLGAVRAKTGTLTGVHALAGTATTADGVVVLAVLVADRVPPGEDLDARTALDRAAAALAACRCAAGT